MRFDIAWEGFSLELGRGGITPRLLYDDDDNEEDLASLPLWGLPLGLPLCDEVGLIGEVDTADGADSALDRARGEPASWLEDPPSLLCSEDKLADDDEVEALT